MSEKNKPETIKIGDHEIPKETLKILMALGLVVTVPGIIIGVFNDHFWKTITAAVCGSGLYYLRDEKDKERVEEIIKNAKAKADTSTTT